MRAFISSLPYNVIQCFVGYNFLWHIIAIILTYIFVESGFDWYYFVATRFLFIPGLIFPGIALGGLLPILVPIICLIFGATRKNKILSQTGWALGQAAIIGSFLSSLYKAFTGRLQPSFYNTTTDISHMFRFGFMRGGIFWGWPSSHTTIACAMSVTLITLFPKNKILSIIALMYALYVGIAVSISIHWFSECIAGIIFGTIIGIVVGRSFRNKSTVKYI